MAEFGFDEKNFSNIIDIVAMVWADLLLQEVLVAVPRDKRRLPKPIKLKRKKKPERNIRKNNKHFYRQPVQINWEWYEWVTGNLARSLSTEKVVTWFYKVWIMAWITEEYWKVQEFWTFDWKIKPRSFLREPLKLNKSKILKQMQKTFNELLSKN